MGQFTLPLLASIQNTSAGVFFLLFLGHTGHGLFLVPFAWASLFRGADKNKSALLSSASQFSFP